MTDLLQLDLPSLSVLLTPERVRRYLINQSPLTYMFACSQLTDAHVNKLQDVANKAELVTRLQRIMAGELVNNGQPVSHFAYRKTVDSRHDLYAFISRVHDGSFCALSGVPFEAIVQVGIGGCELGPRAAYHALRHILPPRYPLHFLSNVDSHHIQDVLSRVPFDRTLFVVASKSGGTMETHAALAHIEAVGQAYGGANVVAVTQPGTVLDDQRRFRHVFYLSPGIGGRFSVSSPVGVLPLGLVFGAAAIEQFLAGAAKQDTLALTRDIWKNPVLMHAMTCIWERNGLGYAALAILPYSEPLRFFGQHLQQLICESNGKTARMDQTPVMDTTSPIVISDVGTNVQHSVFQAVHQGSDCIPVQFLCIKHTGEIADRPDGEKRLVASLIGQSVALAKGKKDPVLTKCFPGNRPSTILALEVLTPEALGALFSFYECSVIFQGLYWGINSFDQEGVELGKTLTAQALTNPDPLLSAFWEQL